jgi:hypothetical protein
MDALNPENPSLTTSPPPLPPRVWKFWGTALWGMFAFGGLFVGQLAVIAYFVMTRDGSFDIASVIHIVGGGLTISLSVMMGLPGVLVALWIAIRPTRTSFADYLALRWTSWKDFALSVAALVVLVGGWDLVSRALGREVTPGFMGDVAAHNRVLRRRSDIGGISCARLSLPRLVGNIFAACRRSRAVVARLDLAASAIRLVLLRRGILDRAPVRLLALSLQLDLAHRRAARAEQFCRDHADVAVGGPLVTATPSLRGASATKQSMPQQAELWIASLRSQ